VNKDWKDRILAARAEEQERADRQMEDARVRNRALNIQAWVVAAQGVDHLGLNVPRDGIKAWLDAAKLSEDASRLYIDGLVFEIPQKTGQSCPAPWQVFPCPNCGETEACHGGSIFVPGNTVLPGETNGAVRPCLTCQQRAADEHAAQSAAAAHDRQANLTTSDKLVALLREIVVEEIGEVAEAIRNEGSTRD